MGNIEFRVLKKLRCVHFVGTGEITFEYLIRRIKDVHSHPDFEFGFDTFVDFGKANVSFKDDGLDSYRSFFNELQEDNIRRKWAIYSEQEMTLISANMSLLLSSQEIHVDIFQNRERALMFLGLTEADLADG